MKKILSMACILFILASSANAKIRQWEGRPNQYGGQTYEYKCYGLGC
jgi:hypothetical protein